jgi:hypothetical protein
MFNKAANNVLGSAETASGAAAGGWTGNKALENR